MEFTMTKFQASHLQLLQKIWKTPFLPPFELMAAGTDDVNADWENAEIEK